MFGVDEKGRVAGVLSGQVKASHIPNREALDDVIRRCVAVRTGHRYRGVILLTEEMTATRRRRDRKSAKVLTIGTPVFIEEWGLVIFSRGRIVKIAAGRVTVAVPSGKAGLVERTHPRQTGTAV